jgi:putative transposase
MSRKLRADLSGRLFHLYARGNARRRIFVDEVDYRRYIGLTREVATDQQWSCLAYCLMPNHVHLMVETTENNLSRGMQRIQGRYASWFNWRHGSVGHLFQGRFGSVPITTERQCRAAAIYIARNPVEAGLATRPDLWPWSSCRASLFPYRGGWPNTGRLLDFFGQPEIEGRKTYAEMALRAPET